jgi:uncharacterized protein (TIGR02678 family)
MRAEGIAMVDPDVELTDVRMPEQRTDGHVTLLVAEYLARREQATVDELCAFLRQAAAEHATYWRKGVTDPGADKELLATALEKLSALRLAHVDRDVIRSLPAIARFALAEPTIRQPGQARQPGQTQTRKATVDAASALF